MAKTQSAKTTIDHVTIRGWVEQRGGRPAHVAGTGSGNDPGLLRIEYPGFGAEDKLEEISWDEWFKAFDEHNLAFLYEDEPESRFSKLVYRDTNGNASPHH